MIIINTWFIILACIVYHFGTDIYLHFFPKTEKNKIYPNNYYDCRIATDGMEIGYRRNVSVKK